MNSNRLSDETLSTTLAAVRAQRRRRTYQRGAAALGLTATLAVALFWRSPETKQTFVESSVPPTVIEPPAEKAETKLPALRIFTTEDVNPKVNILDDEGLAQLLEGRSYGTYVAADGHRRFWTPDS